MKAIAFGKIDDGNSSKANGGAVITYSSGAKSFGEDHIRDSAADYGHHRRDAT